MDWEKHLEKKPIQKLEKISKNQTETAVCEQKTPLARKQFFVQTPFSHSTQKISRRKIPRFFGPHPVSA